MQDLSNRFENAHKFTRLVIDWQHVTTLPTLYVPVIAGVRWVSRSVVRQRLIYHKTLQPPCSPIHSDDCKDSYSDNFRTGWFEKCNRAAKIIDGMIYHCRTTDD